MAATAAQPISRRGPERGEGPIAASTAIYRGTLCFFNASGLVDDDVAAGVNKFAGVADDDYDNSAGAASALKAGFHTEGCFLLEGSGFSQATVGSDIYASDNFTVGTSSSGTTYIGRCVGYVSATKIWVKIVVEDEPGNLSAVDLGDDEPAVFGTGDDLQLLWSTADDDNHTAVLALGASHALHITDVAALDTDWAVAADTHPTLYVHSDTTPITDYLRIGGHTGSAADIDLVGGATLNFKIDGTTEVLMTASILDLASTDLQMQAGGQILDNNGNELIEFVETTSAVNGLRIKNNSTGAMPVIMTEGEADTGIVLAGWDGTNIEEILILDAIATAVNEFTIKNAASGSHPELSATGGGTDINIKLTPKGAGTVDASSGGIRTKQSVANVTEAAPTDSELDSAFGTPAALGRGFIGTIDDNDADSDSILVWTTDASWYHVVGTKST